MDDPDSSASLLVAMGLPVTVSLGTVGPLLRQLRSPKDEIQSLAKDLEGLCISLVEQSQAEEPSFMAKCWMSEVRELCYDTKNYLDEIRTCSDPELELMILEARAKQASERRQSWNIKKLRRLPVLHLELIDRSRMDKLATLLRNEEEKQLKVVSLLGPEGVGKTTLAKRLYHKTGGEFQCRAFVRLSPKPDIRRLFTSIFTQVRRHKPSCRLDAQDLIRSIFEYLRGKRYSIVIDDLWSTSVWDIISRAFPNDGSGSRIITTTQIENVASACSNYQSEYIFEMEPFTVDQSENLFFGVVFGSKDKSGSPEDFARVSAGIIRKCGGLPLLTVNVASLLPTPSETNLQQRIDIRDSFEGMEKVLNLIYNNLSPHLKTCLLYLVMYPEGYTVNKQDLVKQWVAEGFILEGPNKKEIAEEYFDELVSRGMVQAVDVNYGEVLSCTLHRMVYDLIVNKSLEDNFIIIVDYFQPDIGLSDKARRLSVQSGAARSSCIPSGIMVSEIQSLALFGFYECAHLTEEYKLLRVLILHVWADQDELAYDPSVILKLLQLRYLKIECNIPVKLPVEIQALQYLETLEVDAMVVNIPLGIRQLSRLSSLKIAVRKLSRHDVYILQALRALFALSLQVWAEPVEMIVFDKGGFSVLKYFKFRCSVPSLKFEAGSMPDLQNLNLSFNAREADGRGIVPIGIEHLPGLKEINAEIWGADTDVGSTFRTAISNHPSNPRIDVQLVDSWIFYDDTATSMGANEKEYMSEDDDKGEEEKKQAADSSLSTLPQSKRMSTLLGSSVPVQGAAKKPTYTSEGNAPSLAYGPEIKIDGPEKMDIQESMPASPTNKQTDMNWQSGWGDEKKQADMRNYRSAGSSPHVPDSGKKEACESSGKDENTRADISDDPISVPWKDENVKTDQDRTVKKISTRMEEDANLLEHKHDTAKDMFLSDAQPINWHMLKTITEDFSEKMKIGSGNYGAVYKGVLNGDEIAVKKLFPIPGLKDEVFKNELHDLKKVQHKNVLRMLGYCYEISHRDIEYEGKYVWSQVIDRALCYEYMKGGSLAEHISEDSCKYDWPTTYKIIEGTCVGLHYLHKGRGENNYIYHLDLKPDNILLDESLVPKIGDFGLSRLFGESKTHETSNTKGTIGFMPPEYINNAIVTPKNDVFSLGVIIFYMLAGQQGYGDYIDALLRSNFSSKTHQEFIESVQKYWKKKMQATVGYRWDQTDVLGVTKCVEIAMGSVHRRRDSRPSITKIIDELQKLNCQIQEMLNKDPKPPMGVVPFEKLIDLEDNVNDMETNRKKRRQNDSGKDIVVDPSIELRFPFEPKRDVSCCLQLTNKASTFIAFNINMDNNKYHAQPRRGILPPCSKCYITLTLRAREEAPPGMKCLDMAIVQATRVPKGFTSEDISEDFLQKAWSVDELTLPIVYVAQ